jgi:hypothetical protein
MKHVLLASLVMVGFSTAAEVITVRLPVGSMQPRLVACKDGHSEIVFLQGNPDASDVKLVGLSATGALAQPVTISTEDTQAVAKGTVRGPSIALGASESRLVLWHGRNGSAQGGKGSALYFARVGTDGKASKAVDLMGTTTALDGGAAIAADGRGSVWVVWHALPAGKNGESERRIFIRHSRDNGNTFSEPWPIQGEDQGVCACCGLAADLDDAGALHVLYRTAENGKQRGVRLLTLPAGATAGSKPVVPTTDRWNLAGCPMTTAAWMRSKTGIAASWVTEFKLQFSGQGLETVRLEGSQAGQNHPRLARNATGHVLVMWAEGSMWGKGGELVTQTFNAAGKPTGPALRQSLPTWSYGACTSLADGRFVVVF